MATRVRTAAMLAAAVGLGSALAPASSARAEALISLTAGEDHSCAVTASGAVHCWGSNASGQLGNGTTVWSNVPVPVLGLHAHGVAVAAGPRGRHTCALTDAGGVKCWGENYSGQLGDGTRVASRTEPVQVAGLTSGVVAIAAGDAHSCALTSTGNVLCWGANGEGQLGDGTTATRTTPVAVWPPGVFVGIAAGGSHTCGVTNAGAVLCWGSDLYAQIGSWQANYWSTNPVPVNGLSGPALAVTAGSTHTCALLSGGAVQCWGGNGVGQLGTGSASDPVIPPVTVSGFASGATAIDAGGSHTCAATSAGDVLCWGLGSSGQLGDGTTANRYAPVAVPGVGGVSAIAGGATHTCVSASGGLTCWGGNYYGQLGNGASAWTGGAPVAVNGLISPVANVAAGERHTCALGTDGRVTCWGYDGHGELGDDSSQTSLQPVQVVGLTSGVTAIASGAFHTCALTAIGDVWCWGYGGYGQLDDNQFLAQQHVPLAVSLGGSGVALGAGENHTCAVLTDASVRCWGRGDYGQLGNGGTTHSAVPVAVSGLTKATAVAPGQLHTCALRSNGGVRCWGDNTAGQLGDGTTTSSNVPVAVIGLSGPVAKLVSGDVFVCALTATGGVECWGHNGLDELGNGTTANSSVPVPVSGLSSGVVDIAAGTNHTCALLSGGAVTCWGWNGDGQLGDGSTSIRSTPVVVEGLPGTAVALGGGDGHSCAVMSDGGVFCWGRDDYGQLGSGAPLFSATPVLAADFEIPGVPALGPLASLALAAALVAARASRRRAPSRA